MIYEIVGKNEFDLVLKVSKKKKKKKQKQTDLANYSGTVAQ